MAITRFDAIAAAIVAKLKEAPALAGGTVTDETTFDELPEGVNEGIRVTLLESLPTNRAYGNVDWSTTIRIACMARDDRAGLQGRATSRIGADVYLRLMAAQTLGGLAERIDEPRIQPDTNYYGTRLGVLNMDFPVRCKTTDRNLT
jgi:hypothetical protein